MTCKGCQIEKVRILRILNNQHFHSDLCNLWISSVGPSAGEKSTRPLEVVLVHDDFVGRRSRPTANAEIADAGSVRR